MAKKTITIEYDDVFLRDYFAKLALKNDIGGKDLERLEDLESLWRIIKNDLLSGAPIDGMSALAKFFSDLSEEADCANVDLQAARDEGKLVAQKK